jgi:hypothetical protein
MQKKNRFHYSGYGPEYGMFMPSRKAPIPTVLDSPRIVSRMAVVT